MKKKLLRVLSMLLSFIVFASSINISLPVKAEGTTPSVYINPSNTQAVYTYDGYYVVFNLNGSWPGGHNVGIQIYNTGSETIEDWTLESDYSNNISNIWNASVIENENGVTKLYHDTWNSIIYPNSCVEFGYSSNESFESFPTYFGILGSEITETNNELYSIDYTVTDEWEDGYTGLVTITNNSENIIRNWALDFSCNNENISVWNAYIISHNDNRVSVGNMGFNADINPGDNVSFGFIVYNKTNDNEFYNYSLSESAILSNDPPRELEPLGEIGEAYCKELHDEDVVFDEVTGFQYVKNQILISAYMGTPREAIEEIVAEIGATIVGYIEITCDYQIEFDDNKTLDELQIIVNYLQGVSYISSASLNTASMEECEIINEPSDWFYHDQMTFEKIYFEEQNNAELCSYTVYKDKETQALEDWNETNPAGDNWNLEAMHVLSAWRKINNQSDVKVGIYDSYFEEGREDGDLIFDDIINNTDNLNSLQNKAIKHGTHVAGIIGAKTNDIGMAGVSQNVKLYGYAYSGDGNEYTSMMYRKIAFAKLICNHIKVINVSLGYKDKGKIYVASNGNYSNSEKARNSIQTEADIMEEFLKKLVISGYDFIIVCAAGNDNCAKYIYDENNEHNDNYYNFKKCTDDNNSAVYVTNMDARYSYFLNAIDNDMIQNRIIVVGSRKTGTKYSLFSNVGDRVDVCAPGENILSTVPYMTKHPENEKAVSGYELLDGTSMATPHISGLAALMWQANSKLNAIQVKQIICDQNNSNNRSYTNDQIPTNYSYIMPLADKCVETAINTSEFSKNDIDWPKGMIGGSIKSADSGALIPNTKISAVRTSTGDYNLSEYCFSFNSDIEGNYLESLPQGIYDFIFYADGYQPAKVREITINADKTIYWNIELKEWNSRKKSKVGGTIIDGITGNVISGAEIKIRKDWNSYSGNYSIEKDGDLIEAQSNSNGSFKMNVLSGNYTLEIKKEGYLTGYFNVSAFKNSDDSGYPDTFVLSPILPDNEYRIILTWNETPYDLDSHLTYYKDDEMQFHVFWNNKEGYYDEDLIAQLDLDDVDGFGPETVTITVNMSEIDNGIFNYYVYNYSGEPNMSQSNATIRIYHGQETPQILYVPLEAELYWNVFEISNDGLQIINECHI